MSAFEVDATHIDVMVSAALQRIHGDTLRWCHGELPSTEAGEALLSHGARPWNGQTANRVIGALEMSEHHFWTCPKCGNQYTSKDVRDAHVAEDCEAGGQSMEFGRYLAQQMSAQFTPHGAIAATLNAIERAAGEPDTDANWPPVAGSGDPGYDEAAQQELERS